MIGDPEHGAQDHLERDLQHLRMQRERAAARPGREIAARDIADRGGVRRHPLGVERRQHHPAMLVVRLPVERQDRARTDDRFQLAVRHAGLHELRISREDLAQLARRGREHEPAEADEPDREQIAVAIVPALERRHRIAHVGQRLHDRGLGRPRRKRDHRFPRTATIAGTSASAAPTQVISPISDASPKPRIARFELTRSEA